MLKKTFISSLIFLSTSSAVFAKTTSYVGGGLSSGAGTYGATVFGGTGKRFGDNKRLYLGGELDGHVNHNNSAHQSSYGVGASMIPGVMLTESTMLYGRLGLASNIYPRPSNANHFNSLDITTVTGIGLQTKVAEHWDVRTELTSYGSNKSKQAGVDLLYKFD